MLPKASTSWIQDAQLFVFDFDGVIKHSIDVKTQIFRHLYAEYGETVQDKVEAHHLENLGMSRFEKFKLYHREFLGEELRHADALKMSDLISDAMVEGVVNSKTVAGAYHFVETAHSLGRRCIINSGTPETEMVRIINALPISECISAVYGSPNDKVSNLKKAFNDFNIDPSKTIFWGDSKSDWEAAKSFNIPFIGIGEKMRRRLGGNSDQHCCVPDFQPLLDILG